MKKLHEQFEDADDIFKKYYKDKSLIGLHLGLILYVFGIQEKDLIYYDLIL